MKWLWSTAIMAIVAAVSTSYVGANMLTVAIGATKMEKELNKTKETAE